MKKKANDSFSPAAAKRKELDAKRLAKKGKKPRKTLFRLKLTKMTCAELADVLEKPAEGKERKMIQRLRCRYNTPELLARLRLCSSLPALSHERWMHTAAHLEEVPEIHMMVGGGIPNQMAMPTYTKSLRDMAALNGITLHRWGSGAYKLPQHDGSPKSERRDPLSRPPDRLHQSQFDFRAPKNRKSRANRRNAQPALRA